MRAIMISVPPKQCGLIAQGKQTMIVCKTVPKTIEMLKCYIYCTKDSKLSFWRSKTYAYTDDRSHNMFDIRGNGKVIGEFVCDRIDIIDIIDDPFMTYVRANQHSNMSITNKTCLSLDNLHRYLGNKIGYGRYISNLIIYDEPRRLSDFTNGSSRLEFNKTTEDGFPWKYSGIQKPPRSWYYVDDLEEST